jgi:hypothetical protein
VKSQTSDYKEQSFKAGDFELKFSIDDSSKEAIESSIINNDSFFLDNYVKEGAVDYGRLKRDLLLIANQDKILKMAYDQGVSSGKEAIADKLENADEGAGKASVDNHKSYEEQIAEQLKAKGFRIR